VPDGRTEAITVFAFRWLIIKASLISKTVLGVPVRKIIFVMPVAAAAMIIPILAANAIDEADVELQAKERVDEMIKALRDQLGKTGGDPDLDKRLAGLEDFKDVIVLSEQIQQAAADDKPELKRQLEEKLEYLKEHAGDRYIEVTATPEGEA